jgi:hypothetical protein
VSESYVREVAGRVCPGKAVSRFPRGLGSYQDLYILHDRDDRPFDIDQGPFGFASVTRLADEELHVIGWASHRNPARSVRHVVVALNGDPVSRVDSFFPRRDVVELLRDERHLRSGWHARFRIPESASQLTDVVTITATSDHGVETFLYAGTIAGLLLRSCRDELRAFGRERVVFPEKDELERELAERLPKT